MTEIDRALAINPNSAISLTTSGGRSSSARAKSIVRSQITTAHSLLIPVTRGQRNKKRRCSTRGRPPAATTAPGQSPAQALTAQAAQLMQQRKSEEAIAIATRAIDADPKWAQAYAVRGLARLTLGQDTQALEDLDQAIKLKDRDTILLNTRGLLLVSMKRLDDAFSDFDHVLTIDPKNADAISNRGYVFRLKGDLPGAMVEYDRALAINPRYAPSLSGTRRSVPSAGSA